MDDLYSSYPSYKQMAETLNQQVRFKLSKNGGVNADSTKDNGDIIFDSKNKIIYAQGTTFDCKNVDSHAINEFSIYTDGVETATFNQILDTSINFVSGTGIEIERSVSPTTLKFNINGDILNSNTAKKLSDAEAVGANNSFVYFLDGVPKATNISLGDENTPIYIKDGSFITGKTINADVNDNMFTIMANDTSVRTFTSNQSFDTSIRFISGTGITVSTVTQNSGVIRIDHNEPEVASVYSSTEDVDIYAINSTLREAYFVSGVSRDVYGHVQDVSIRKITFDFCSSPLNESKRSSQTTLSYSANIEKDTLFWYDID